jgi:hypothetical protein
MKFLGPARNVITVAILMTVVSISGCAQAPGVQGGKVLSSEDIKGVAQRERDAGHIETADLMANGAVDKAAYDKAFNNLQNCMLRSGYDVSAPVLNPGDGISYVFTYLAQGRDPVAMDKVSLECERRYWQAVSATYVNTNEQTMEEPVRAAAQKCMAEAGFQIADDVRNAKAMAGDPLKDQGAQRKAATTCIVVSIYELHPEIKAVGIGW